METQFSINQIEFMFPSVLTTKENKEEFRKQFQRSLKKCVAKGFSVEDCFGLVWEETIEKIPPGGSQSGTLYEELIDWARKLP